MKYTWNLLLRKKLSCTIVALRLYELSLWSKQVFAAL